MNQVKIRIKGPLKKPFGKAQFEYACEDDTTISRLLDRLGYTEEQMRYITASVNYRVESHRYVLKEGDEVILMAMVGGG